MENNYGTSPNCLCLNGTWLHTSIMSIRLWMDHVLKHGEYNRTDNYIAGKVKLVLMA